MKTNGTLKTIKLLALASLFVGFISCDDDDDNAPPLLDVETETVSNLHAPEIGGRGEPISGPFTKFDFETGTTTTSDTDWDIAFRGTTIIVNGGASMGTVDEPERTGNAAAYIASGTMATVTEVNTSLFVKDSETGYAIPTGGDGWYSYNPTTHIITAIAGKVLVFRTRDGKYAKVEILSYYKDAPDNPTQEDETPYYTFNYVFQPNEGVTSFE
jgi:hypothetical protein